MFEIVFWQRIVSPHMACLAQEVASLGNDVKYVTAETMSKDRVALGWSSPNMKDVRLDYIDDSAEVGLLLKDTAPETVHLVQGIRGNGYVGHVINCLRQRQARWGAFIETIREPFGLRGIKRMVYKWKLGRSSKKPGFVLAIGEKTPSWLFARGYPRQQIFPFTYFLDSGGTGGDKYNEKSDTFRVGFAGELNRRKQVDILVDALAFDGFRGMELVVVGNGPLESELKAMTRMKLSHMKLHWLGQLPMAEARSEIADMDCLVLPSRHDGWGAVVSEALMAGVPAICSDACGAAVAVRASGVGGVFSSGDVMALRQLLIQVKTLGRLEPAKRQCLARWASCLGTTAGAVYLSRILEFLYNGGARPSPPWAASGRSSVRMAKF